VIYAEKIMEVFINLQKLGN